MSKIEFRNVSFSYEADNKAVNILDGLNFKVEEGEFACLIGPSGCGKSTLVSLLLGLQFPTKGEILINDKPVTGPDVNRGMVFQHYSLFPWLTAKKNIMFGIKEAGLLKSRKEIAKRAEEYLELVGLADSADKYPHELSGGMQQRVALARAFAMDTDILLMDEPFGAIDPQKRIELQELSIELCKKRGEKKTVVFITHDIDEALVLADKVYFMEPHKIRTEVNVGLPADTPREELIRLNRYDQLRHELLDLFTEVKVRTA
ncbi:ABC transporter ATP-binding protein [Ruminococcus albus]|uniref:NitT/TauT family transport system ATP-binding protein n=1 Tax=Ruminococcus albus TaxID=1264 RepID=A0A1I1JF08_RUMAL|nr:ABC transporter ATP-binding protein [Ruminococcus albus]SFC47179.1 NitT/TauT family transport system ATP-binding protein [Ruminococcus albus]